ncbi:MULTISPECIES: SLAC1 family transporter [unclassified Nocardioides]|uniref:SLAC1 family transporter n=1 Tax=Nocardioides sp. URHA0032 TaxID=1380388 RepID=UPI00048F53B8|nr:hypothetical protein [Nocardioides sp. URHA0032]
MSTEKVTPPHFGIPFGFAGLAGAWRLLDWRWAQPVADLLAGFSAVVLLVLVTQWLSQLWRRDSHLAVELRDPVQGPSVPVCAITAMLLSGRLVGLHLLVGRPLVVCFAALTLAGGSAVVAAWLLARLPLRSYHPGFYLPTAGGSLLAAQALGALGHGTTSRVLLGVGVACWLVLGVVTTVRLVVAPLPAALRPALVIELAAPALAANTYLTVNARYDGWAVALTVLTLLLALAQVPLAPYYRAAPFGIGHWSAGFSYATVAALALRWVDHEQPPAATVWSALTITFATGVLAALSVATLRADRRAR